MLDLVNSKACRGVDIIPLHSIHKCLMRCVQPGAVMFNDPLDLDQCRRLVQLLSETVFPFQCAHGRWVSHFSAGILDSATGFLGVILADVTAGL
jgi:DNA mismatch repair ATPase MutL